MFLIHELLINIVHKNYISSFSLIRTIIENLYIIAFLKNSSDYVNQIYYEYSQLCLINIWDDAKVLAYENKYSVKINKKYDKQWIEQIKKKSGYNGFSYIKNEVNKTGKNYFDDWYKQNSNFIHSSISATRLNVSLFLDDDNKYSKFIYHFLSFIVYELLELFKLNEEYLSCNKNEKYNLLKKIETFIDTMGTIKNE